MNIVYDAGLILDEKYRKALYPILPEGYSPLMLDSETAETNGTINTEEGIVFLTDLPIDILEHHAKFFENHNKAPQWFFILLSNSGMSELINAGRRYDLRNCKVYQAYEPKALKTAAEEIAKSKHIRGKTLFLTKHERKWTEDFAGLLYGKSRNYEIMYSAKSIETNAANLLLCGEEITDFADVALPNNMEPYFVCRYKNDIQNYINSDILVNVIAECYDMTVERVRTRLYFIDIESELWFNNTNKSIGIDAIKDGILLWDRFGLPVSRDEYTQSKIEDSAGENHQRLEDIRKILM